MKTGWRIALYLTIMLSAGILLFKDNLFHENSQTNFENFVDKEGRLARPFGRNGKPLPIYLYTEKAAGGFIFSTKDLASFLPSFASNQKILSRET